MKKKMKSYFFTFGCGQEHENGYVVITAHDASTAREIMIASYGKKWSMQYDSAEEAGVGRFHLFLVDALTESGSDDE